MPMLQQCSRDGCEVLTMGEFCLAHEDEESPNREELTSTLTTAAAAAVDAATAADG